MGKNTQCRVRLGGKMKVVETYSCWNGLEFLFVHKPELWDEIKNIITSIDYNVSNMCRINKIIKENFRRFDWNIFKHSNQTDFVKNRVAIEVQFGKYAFVAYDLFVKHLAFYIGNYIDVGVEILPMKTLQSQMSSGPSYYEGELYNVVRQGRGVPAVPLVIIGIEP
jgi:hypothetical protein